MTDKLGADHPLLVEVIESHQDRLRVMELVEAERDELRAENERLNGLLDHSVELMNDSTLASGFVLQELAELRAENERLRARNKTLEDRLDQILVLANLE